MNTLDLARTQFAVTTLFHFIFVPISIGLALFVAICQTRYYFSQNEVYLRMTKFWGKFLLISMAIGVVTGIVQEFQFGMNWALYSKYVGDIFGAPLAMEGLIAFFLESTFIGLWIFGWGRLSPVMHLWTIWLTAAGTALSAYFILAANSWMQHPVGYVINHAAHKAQLNDIFAVLLNPTVLLAYPHVIFAAWTTASMLVIAISALLLLRRGKSNAVPVRSLKMAIPMALVSVLLAMGFGDGQGRLLLHEQPMKMAAAEGIYHNEKGGGLSVFAAAPVKHNPGSLTVNVQIPHLLSLVETLSWDGSTPGMDTIQAQERTLYGPGNYIPIVGILYWCFRLMIGAGMLMAVIAGIGLFKMARRNVADKRWYLKLALLGAIIPIVGNWTGWIFTEVGRQPWVVFGLLKTSDARSTNVSSTDIVITLAGYILIYSVLIVTGVWLMMREIKHGPEPDPVESENGDGTTPPTHVGDPDLVLAY